MSHYNISSSGMMVGNSSVASFERSQTGCIGSLDNSVLKPDFTHQSTELTETLAKLKNIRNGMKTLYGDKSQQTRIFNNRSTSGTETCHDSNLQSFPSKKAKSVGKYGRTETHRSLNTRSFLQKQSRQNTQSETAMMEQLHRRFASTAIEKKKIRYASKERLQVQSQGDFERFLFPSLDMMM